jgi:O-antigen biosynthesis protein WbqP
MSFIGPRPLLSTEKKLLSERERFEGNNLKPGITGWAQINGRDLNSIHEKVQLDEQYMKNKNFFLDIKIVLITLFKILLKKQISH